MLLKKLILILFFVILILLPIGGIFGAINSFKLFSDMNKQKKYALTTGIIVKSEKDVFAGLGFRPQINVKLNDGTIIKLILLSDLTNSNSNEISFYYDGVSDKIYYYFNFSEYLLLFLGIFAIIATIIMLFVLFKMTKSINI